MIKIIAEIGWNHMGDMDLAKKMITSAASCGVDICKFQTWSEKNLKPGPWDNDGRRDIYKKAELSEENHIELIEFCKDNSVEFLTSVFNIDDLGFLESLDMDMIKIPSHEIHNIELINTVVEKFSFVLISTGASKWIEIEEIIKNVDINKISLMHCVSAYPCPPEKINFPRMKKLSELCNSVGYSGHLPGIEDAISAICNGAKYVEKHFTVDQDLPGRDNKFAILPSEMKKLTRFRDLFQKMNLDCGLDLQDCEFDTYENYRGRWSKSG